MSNGCGVVRVANDMQVVEYMANQLLANYSSDDTIKDVVDKYDVYMFPVVNPDGSLILSVAKVPC